MALKNFGFRENLVANDMVGMKIVFFAIFDPTWTLILALKRPNMEFFNPSLRGLLRGSF